MSQVLGSTRKVLEQSEHVSLNQEAIKKWAKDYEAQDTGNWLDTAPFDVSTLSARNRLHYLLILNAISFSYWGNAKWKKFYKGNHFDGAYAMIASLGKAIEDGVPLTDFAFLADITEEEFEDIVKGQNQIPLFGERLNILRQIGKIVRDHFSGSVMKLMESVESAKELLMKFPDIFPSFKDESTYKGEPVIFLKRAQLFIADAFQTVEETRAQLKSIAGISACADYKLPQMLRRYGIFEYSPELQERIRNFEEIPHGDPIEVEIRSATIWAVEEIKKQLKSRIPDITSNAINDRLWILGQTKEPGDEPYHRSRTTAY